MYRTKQDKLFLKKIIQNHLSRKTKKFRRNFHLNKVETDVCIIKVKKKFLENFGGYNELPDKTVFSLFNKKYFNTVFFRCTVDILSSDANGSIIEYYKEVIPNKKIKFPSKTRFIWIMKPNLVNYLKIDIKKDIVGTK